MHNPFQFVLVLINTTDFLPRVSCRLHGSRELVITSPTSLKSDVGFPAGTQTNIFRRLSNHLQFGESLRL